MGIYYVSSPARAQLLVYETVQNSISCDKAYFVRSEKIYYADASGTLYNNVIDGERIASNSLLTTIYHANVSADILTSLKTVDKKIADETDKRDRLAAHSLDFSNEESTIAAIVREIPAAAQKDNIADIAKYKDIINSIRMGEDFEDEDKLESLYAEKELIESGIKSSKSELRTDMAGVFTTYIDGLEPFLMAENIEDYTPSYLDSLPSQKNERLTNVNVSKNSPVCKVQNNHVWYLVMALPTEELPECNVGRSVSLKLDTITSEEVDGEIYFISEDENGKTLVAIKCSTYLEGAFSYRETPAELVFKSHPGYKVPVYAIRTDENNQKYVLCRSGINEYKCYCTIDYTNQEEEYIVINTAPDSTYKLEDMEQVVIGEK